jgi:hypothetical protein
MEQLLAKLCSTEPRSAHAAGTYPSRLSLSYYRLLFARIMSSLPEASRLFALWRRPLAWAPVFQRLGLRGFVYCPERCDSRGGASQIDLTSPPSMRSVEPVIQRAPGDTRNAISSAISSGSP